jgi:glutamate/tyrosine decarboxylase-like PLP-dependent enzyme
VVEEVVGGWLKPLFGLPAHASFGLVSGGQAGNTVALAAARHHVLAQAGWDVERDGLNGAPAIRVVASEERHATIDRALRLLGLGTRCVVEGRGDDERRDRRRWARPDPRRAPRGAGDRLPAGR